MVVAETVTAQITETVLTAVITQAITAVVIIRAIHQAVRMFITDIQEIMLMSIIQEIQATVKRAMSIMVMLIQIHLIMAEKVTHLTNTAQTKVAVRMVRIHRSILLQCMVRNETAVSMFRDTTVMLMFTVHQQPKDRIRCTDQTECRVMYLIIHQTEAKIPIVQT